VCVCVCVCVCVSVCLSVCLSVRPSSYCSNVALRRVVDWSVRILLLSITLHCFRCWVFKALWLLFTVCINSKPTHFTHTVQ